ncbi:glycine--tRNA ligase subunit beta [Nitrincola alkalisediminis]|uniref:glycine--tRNA ligase subunit beta n=1 Tax=Nitrincola alkalisediminis TaxID=1366656 RepID=UPI0018756191|nr:glycine--tRNA ligase subunit beta [Nitrincola alkalisediminis]
MVDQQDFLVELGTEELPPKALKTLSNAFLAGIESGLQQNAIQYDSARAYASPRRLAVIVSGLSTQQPDRVFEKRGPATSAPEKAVQGFAGSCGVTLAELETMEVGKGTYYVYRGTEAGKQTQDLLPEIVAQSLNALPIPKRMRWGARRTEFVRPVHWLVMLMGDQVIPCEILGLTSGNTTRGHRFHFNQTIELASAAEYEAKLLSPGKVIVDFDRRMQTIEARVLAEARKLNARVVIDPSLLEEVAALNEWPVALTGRFEERFLDVPSEALISSMKANQKYFHLVDTNNQLLPYFITVANIESNDPAQIISGNEKVIRPRLADAAFFFNQDKQHPLISRTEKLKSIVFQHDLGTVFEKTQRIETLATAISERIGGNPAFAARAAQLSKCDLMTDMVFEFTELQGLMGYHYALHDGEPAEVASALNEQYMPRFSGDELPHTRTGIALALADRLDTLTGLFGINQPPTGSKDPFALRRQSLGILRIIIEHQLDLDLVELTNLAASQYGQLPGQADVAQRVVDFMLDRFKAWYDEQAISAEIYLSVHALRPTQPLDFDKRIQAVAAFTQLPEAKDLAAANKRVSNILSKQGTSDAEVNENLLVEVAEKTLYQLMSEIEPDVNHLFSTGAYTEAMQRLAKLNDPINQFFDDVMVMAEDEALRLNRLALLSKLRKLFLGVADISLL